METLLEARLQRNDDADEMDGDDFNHARITCRESISRSDNGEKIKWSIIHSHYANLGGFVIEFLINDNPRSEALPVMKEEDIELATREESGIGAQGLSLAHGIFDTENPGPKAFSMALKKLVYIPADGNNRETVASSSPQYTARQILQIHPNADKLLSLRRHSFHPALPTILDKNKGNLFVKGTVLIQVIWLVVQVLIRTSRGLPISHLEIAVLAFATCTFFTYILSWNKPQGINCPTYIVLASPIRNRAVQQIREITGGLAGYTGTRVSSLFLVGPPNVNYSTLSLNDVEYNVFPRLCGWELPFSWYFHGLSFTGTLFGVVHCLAWNFHFPSATEMLLWRMSSVMATAWTPLYATNFIGYRFVKRVPGALKVLSSRKCCCS
jgi:hypothetical protein